MSTLTYELAVEGNLFISRRKDGARIENEIKLIKDSAVMHVDYKREEIYVNSFDHQQNKAHMGISGSLTYSGITGYVGLGDTTAVSLPCGSTVTPTQNFADLVLFVTDALYTDKLQTERSIDLMLLDATETPVAQNYAVTIPSWAVGLKAKSMKATTKVAGTGDTLDVELARIGDGDTVLVTVSIADGETVGSADATNLVPLLLDKSLNLTVTNAPGNTERGLSVSIQIGW